MTCVAVKESGPSFAMAVKDIGTQHMIIWILREDEAVVGDKQGNEC